MRLLIFLGLIYVCYRALKSWLLQHADIQKTAGDQTNLEIDDLMVQDPVCQIYFPRRDATRLKADGQDLYFCSPECRDKFIALRSKK